MPKDCNGGCGGTCGQHHRDAIPMRYLSVEKLGPKQHLTPEGFLICLEVPIARTGPQLYNADEVSEAIPLAGLVKTEREAEQVFNEITMKSFEGKPVTIDHPVEDVDPTNWKRLAVGVVQNVRRGSGVDDNLLLADLLITDMAGIEAVRDGLREVSCGYDAKFEQIEPGRGRLINIIGNHVALVEAGRCGSRCAIQDRSKSMTKKLGWLDRAKAAFHSRNEDDFTQALAEADNGVTVNLIDRKDSGDDDDKDFKKKVMDWMAARDAEREEEKKKADAKRDAEKEEEDKKKIEDAKKDEEKDLIEGGEEYNDSRRDSVSPEVLYNEIAARAEIIAPGVVLPKISQKAIRDSKVHDALCVVKRHALRAGIASEAGLKAISPFLDGRTVDALTCDAVNNAFVGAAEVMRNVNNTRRDSASRTATGGGNVVQLDPFKKGGITAINKQFWDNKKKGN